MCNLIYVQIHGSIGGKNRKKLAWFFFLLVCRFDVFPVCTMHLLSKSVHTC